MRSDVVTLGFIRDRIAETLDPVTAVTLDTSNVGGTINFNPAGGGSGLDITTTSGTGFSALGGGTISVQGAGNSINTGTGTALDDQYIGTKFDDVIGGGTGIDRLWGEDGNDTLTGGPGADVLEGRLECGLGNLEPCFRCIHFSLRQ